MAQADTRPEPPFRGRATIRDIADLAGVSIATVSRVLNDRPDVAPETRENVLQVVRQHGFSTNRGARGLSSGRTGMVGLTLPLVADAYFGPMLSGAAEALYERDMRIVLAPTLHEHDREVSLLERLMRGTTDGAILMLPEESVTELLMLQRQGFPFVVVDPREPPPDGIACVAAMHAAGAKEATEHLLELGHRRIGAIAGAPGWYATEERLLGFRAALAGAGILLDPELVVYSDWRIPSGIAAAEQLLALPDPPTAIFGFNDNVAIGALHAARSRGLTVPDDLSVVGFDDTEPAVIVTPRLTSVRQPLAEMGRMGVSLLTRIIEGQRVDALRMELSTKLVVRDSTAPPRSLAVRVAIVAALVVTGVAVGATLALGGGPRNAYTVHGLVSDEGRRAPNVDRSLVNAWGLAASPTGPWWTSNEASATSTLYSSAGRKQLLTVHVAGGPTGVAFYGGKGFRVSSGRASDPARFVYACEDGMLRAWTPTVPTGWSTTSVVVVDEAATAAVFRGVTILGDRVYATDFHNARVNVYDSHWRRVRRAGAFVDRSIPDWYAPFGIQAIGSHVFVTYVYRAPVNGNDAPTGGFVDEFDGDGRLVARIARRGALNAPWGVALAPRSFGRFGGDLLVGNFGDGRINAYRRAGAGWSFDGTLEDTHGKPLVVNGLWAIAFGNDGMAGSSRSLFFTSGPHQWRGETELGVHGLLGSIAPA